MQEREKEEEKEKEKEKEQKKAVTTHSTYLKIRTSHHNTNIFHIASVDLSLTIITTFPTSHKPLKKAQQLLSSSTKTNTDNLF